METQFESPQTGTDVETEFLSKPSVQGSAEASAQVAPVDPVRSVNFILDPSAFTLGLGNIERWFDKEYFQSQVKNKNENIHLNLYLPTYTLHELDYQRRGPIVGSSKASEALKFMDRLLESEDDGILDEFVEIGEESTEILKGKAEPEHFSFNLSLEQRTHHFPQWSTCEKFQIRSPSSQELRHHGKYSLYDEINHIGGGNYDDAEDEGLALPSRLKHLIRSGVYLTKMKHNGPPSVSGNMWKLVTEDPTTKVWASCFGIDCLNINEAELLLFHGKDLTNFEIKSEGANFFSGEDIYQNDAPDSLHKKVNTTSYKYTNVKSLEEKKSKNKKKKATKKPKDSQGADESSGVRVEGGVLTEDFNMINYAPREEKSKLLVSKMFSKESEPVSRVKKSPKSKAPKKTDASKPSKSDTVSAAKKQDGESSQKTNEKKKTVRKKKAPAKKPVLVTEEAGPTPVGVDSKDGTEQSAQKKPAKKTRRKKKPVAKKDVKEDGAEVSATKKNVKEAGEVPTAQEESQP